jgi:hypothetical protein
MNVSTIITAVIILGIVWGGLIIFLFKASSFEKKKKVNGKED